MDPSNPFVHKIHLSPLQKVKICFLGVILVPLRLLLALVGLLVCTSLAWVGLLGLEEGELDNKPFTGWRLKIRHFICAVLRITFAACGFWGVKVIGKQVSPEEAPILAVAPHSTFFDALAVIVMGAPSVVAKADTGSIPFWGSLIKYTQPVLVQRTDPDSRKNTVRQISERSVAGKGWQQVLVFPEGTCTNRTCLITFRLGAFIPGVPVQPVIIRYNNVLDTVTWTWEGVSTWKVIVYTLSQVVVNMSVEYLDPCVPSQEEIEDPKLFAYRVREVMAQKMGVGTTDCSYYDYLRIAKTEERVKALQRLQRRVESPLVQATANLCNEGEAGDGLEVLGQRTKALVEELCGTGEKADHRFLRLEVLLATEEDSYTAFINHSFSLLDKDLGSDRMSESSLKQLCEHFLYLTSRESDELLLFTIEEGEVSKDGLHMFFAQKRPNYIKIIKKWEDGLSKDIGMDLGMGASLTRSMGKARDMVAGGLEVVGDVTATMAASREKVSDVLNSAVTSLHKRTGSWSGTDKKSD